MSVINYKVQITNPKQISKYNVRMLKVSFFGISVSSLGFVCFLDIIIWCFLDILKKSIDKSFAKMASKRL